MKGNTKENLSKVFTEVWNLGKKYLFIHLDDAGWQSFTADGAKVMEQFKEDDELQQLCRHMIIDLISYKGKRNE